MCFQVYKGIKKVDYKVDSLGLSFPLWGQAVLLRPTQNESGIGLKDSDYVQPCPTSQIWWNALSFLETGLKKWNGKIFVF